MLPSEDVLEADGLPPIISELDLENVPHLAPPLIHGVLRRSHKMLLAGPSKAGKSFTMIQLAVCIATGTPWLGFRCEQGRVLYVNMEIDAASFARRVRDVAEAMGEGVHKKDHFLCENMYTWNLRGYVRPIDKLAPVLIHRAKSKGYSAIIIDPLYKVLTGAENKAGDMAKFFGYFDKIAMETGAAVIYCHHHGKGNQGWKNVMDRASGSGVFARDPDALLDLIELELPPELRQEGTTAWRIEGTLREFPPFDPVDVWFNYPLHVLADFKSDEVAPHNELASWRRAMYARKSKEEKKRERARRLEDAYAAISGRGMDVTIAGLTEYMGVTDQSVRNFIDEHPHFERENGVVRRVE